MMQWSLLSPVLDASGAASAGRVKICVRAAWVQRGTGYVTDNERRHSLAGVAEYQRLVDAYPALGYEVTILPKVGVAERTEFVLRTLAG